VGYSPPPSVSHRASAQKALQAFGATLIPILTAAGIELNEPIVAQVQNEIKA
jgi:hypothetical protein